MSLAGGAYPYPLLVGRTPCWWGVPLAGGGVPLAGGAYPLQVGAYPLQVGNLILMGGIEAN